MILDTIKQKLIESEIRYRRLFETARDGILILDFKSGEIEDVNPFLEQLLGYSKKEFLGKRLWEVGAFKNNKTSKGYFQVLKETGYVRYDNLPLIASDGREIEVEFISNVYVAGTSKVIQCNIRDVSEKRKIEAGVEAHRLLEVEKTRGGFIADATHEFRTPLAIIKGNVYLGLKSKKGDYKAARRALRAVDKEVVHLSELLSDLTNITINDSHLKRRASDYQAERVVYLDTVNILRVVRSSVARCKTLAQKKKISISLSNKFPSITIMGDKMYIEKLFMNIINNAILYGKEGGQIKVTGVKDSGFIKINIADNGIGIAKEDIAHIFDRFFRAENGRAGNTEGTGLGLAISKWVTEAHGGSISVKSSIGKETVFTILLPLNAD